ncbi:response regulator [Actomonas aquatica]|uniref:Response regulator n=1 Tax=Actomonas aquatica TaxID=2866162 RepID=A0ABZ1C7B3_9BACT|nr:response regulator [Opitutus sp. WL0086]WRQ87612.1 response regulator [Opitutus sp. WL0086]
MPEPSALSDPAPTILVIDDEKPVRVVAGKLLERLGHPIGLCSCASEALRCVERAAGSVRLVFVDLRLGEEDGLDLARRLRAYLPRVPLVLMGGDISEVALRFEEENKLIFLLPKPFDFAGLRRMLQVTGFEREDPEMHDGGSCLSRSDSAKIPPRHDR